MSSVRRTALSSVVAAAVLIALKLGVGLTTNSLGFISEAAHSGTDLAAALLTFFAVGVASRPADATHGFGHGKAEHLSALAESAVLAVASVLIAVAAFRRLATSTPPHVDTAWWAFAVIGLVIAIDVARMTISLKTARHHGSAALRANALHFAGDAAGSVAVLVGLALTRAGSPRADAAAALFVACLVFIAAVRMSRVNVDVLMDRTPSGAERRARQAIEALQPGFALRRLRMREAAGQHFADVVIALPAAAALAEGHAVADAVETAVRQELPGADVVVHVEPESSVDDDLRERALAAALAVPGVREIHNVRVFQHEEYTHVALHLKLPGTFDLAAAHRIASQVEKVILADCDPVTHVTTHLEPLDEPVSGATPGTDGVDLEARIDAGVRALTGIGSRTLQLLRTPDGVIALIDVAMDGTTSLAEAHILSGVLRRSLREEIPELLDAIIHTEPHTDRPDSGASGPDAQ